MPKRKGRAQALEAPNLKRFRDDLTEFVFEGAMKGDASVGPSHGGMLKTGKPGMNRKEKRKLMKKEKKAKARDFQLKKQGKETLDSDMARKDKNGNEKKQKSKKKKKKNKKNKNTGKLEGGEAKY